MKLQELEDENRIKKRVLILRKLMLEGKIIFAENMREKIEESFSKARFDNNGEPDIETIDGTIRAIALMAETIDYRNKLKESISLYQIQEKYFEIIEGNFGLFHEMMVTNNSTPHRIANHIANELDNIDFINDSINDILTDIDEFWEVIGEIAHVHMEDEYDSIKAVFGGDLFPAQNENIASKCGIYTDTIILPCPFIRCQQMFNIWDKRQRVYFMLKHALNILRYKELALADLSKPIIVILPDKEMMNENIYKGIKTLGDKDGLYHAGKVFGKEFESMDELMAFAKKLDTVEKVITEIKDRKKVLFDADYRDSLASQISKQINGGLSSAFMGIDNPGIVVSLLGVGRMGVCNELLAKSLKFRGIPLIEAPTSWQYFKWKLQYDSERANPDKYFSQMHIVRGLNGLSDTKLSWLGKIPPKGLIEIRKNGAINEIREILSKGIDELITANALEFTKTSNKVFENLNIAFNEHQKNIDKLVSKKWKVAGRDFGSWIVIGSIEIASACVGTPLFGASTFFLNQVLDAPKLKDLPKTINEIKGIDKQKEILNKSPIGLMFKYKK